MKLFFEKNENYQKFYEFGEKLNKKRKIDSEKGEKGKKDR